MASRLPLESRFSLLFQASELTRRQCPPIVRSRTMLSTSYSRTSELSVPTANVLKTQANAQRSSWKASCGGDCVRSHCPSALNLTEEMESPPTSDTLQSIVILPIFAPHK